MATKFTGPRAISQGLDDLIKRLGLQETKLIKQLARAYCEEAALLIYQRVKAGSGVESPGGQAKPLKPLSPSYIARRQNFPHLHSTTSPARSNLTLTGQMLDGLTVVESAGRVKLTVLGTRHDGKTNKAVATWVSIQGRPWLNLSQREQTVLAQSFRRNFAFLAKQAIRR
jgi:hypothetical protein